MKVITVVADGNRRVKFIAQITLMCIFCIGFAHEGNGQVILNGLVPWALPHDLSAPLARDDLKYMAASDDYKLQVFTMKNGVPDGKVVWDSQKAFPRSMAGEYEWLGADLVFSLLTSQHKELQELNDAEEFALTKSRGQTIILNISTGVCRLLYPQAFIVLKASPRNDTLLMASATDEPLNDLTIRFFDIQTGKVTSSLVKKSAGNLAVDGNYLIGWKKDSSGVYITANNESPGMSDDFRRRLYFVDSKAKMRSILPDSDSVFAATRFKFPSATFTLDGNLAVGIEDTQQRFNTVLVDDKSIVDGKTWLHFTDLFQGENISRILLAVAPNNRFALVEEMTVKQLNFNTSEMWVYDIKRKRKRPLVTMARISHAGGWHESSFRIAYDENLGDDTLRFGLLRVEGADWPADDPRLDAMVAAAPWVDCHPEEKALERTLSAFLRRPDIGVLSPADTPNFATQGRREGLMRYRFTLAPGRFADFGLDNAGQIAYFAAPPPLPPLPEQPLLDAEQVGRVATTFLKAFRPAIFAALPTTEVQVAPINASADYVVTFGQTRGISHITHVRVRASTGTISGYDRDASASPRPQAISAAATADAKPGTAAAAAQPVRIGSDGSPRWSPNGEQLAFVSSRPRPGYPAWWPGRGNGLYTMRADGSDLKLLAPAASSTAYWSPDGRSIAYENAGQVMVQAVAGGPALALQASGDAKVSATVLGWTRDRLLVGWLHNGAGGFDLMGWQQGDTGGKLTLLMSDWGKALGSKWNAGGFALGLDGETGTIAWRLQNDTTSEFRFALYAFSTTNWQAPPRLVTQLLHTGSHLCAVPQGILVAGAACSLVNIKDGTITVVRDIKRALAGRNDSEGAADFDVDRSGRRLAVARKGAADQIEVIELPGAGP